MTERKQISLQKNDRQAALDEYQRDGLIESADWLEDCADCMDDEGLDRDNHARHFRAGANAIRAALSQDVNAELLEALEEAWSVISSINYGKNHVIKRSDGEVLYGQTDEWCKWALKESLPKVEQAIARAEAQKVGE